MVRKSLPAVLCLLWLGPVWPVFAGQDPSLVGWWRLDESSGTVATDASGQGNHASLGGSAGHIPGLYGGGVYCDGTEAYVAIPGILTPSCTVAFWFKPDWDGTNPSDYRLFDASLGDKYFFIGKGANHADITPQDFGFYFEDGADTDWQGIEIRAAGNILAATWYHVAVTWQFGGGVAILYLNGKEIARGTNLGAFPTLFANPRFGYQSVAYIPITRGAAAVLDDIKVFNRVLPAEEIPAVMKGAALGSASTPSPADGAVDVPRDATLSWTAGRFPGTHDVYFGTTFADVNTASRTSAKGPLVSQGQAATTFDPPGLLTCGQTYYWRIDEVNSAPDQTIYKGSVWSFTSEPYGYPVKPVKATASSFQTGMGPEKTIDGSGLNPNGLHDAAATTMWMSSGVQPNWIQYEFDKVYKLHQLLVWNTNQPIEAMLGFGAKKVTVETSTDGTTWTALANVPEFARALGEPDYAANTTVNFGGIEAKFVKLTINANWGGLAPQTGLAEVRFSYVPVQARAPQPAAAAIGVSVDTDLNWRPGRDAASHSVYFGTDSNTLGAAKKVTDHSFDPGALNFGTRYYWKVDEVNTITYPGDLWSFTTQEFAAIDDFESYTDKAGAEVFSAWVDGVTDGLSNSVVGLATAVSGTFCDRVNFRGGKASMPFEYNNVKPPFYSQAERTFDKAQDWTTNGATHLGLWVRGQPAAFVDKGNGAFTVGASGHDIWDAADDFRFVYKKLSGDGSIVVKVDSLVNTNAWAKAGVMIRQSLTDGSPMADMVIASTNGANFQWRATAGANADSTNSPSVASIVTPQWVKLTRKGNVFSGQYSGDGKTWLDVKNPTLTGTPVTMTVNMTGEVYIGLCLTSHDSGLTTTAEFSSAATTGSVTGAWQQAWIGDDLDRTNGSGDLYLTVKDSAGKAATLSYPGGANVSAWTLWKIPLSDLTAAGVKTTSIKKTAIGVGDPAKPTVGGAGKINIDDIGYGHPAQ